MSYNGARVLSEFALLQPDLAAARAALESGESLLAGGCIGSNHLWFFRDAIDVSLKFHDFNAALNYAQKLSTYTSDEPLVWTEIFVRRCRLFAAIEHDGPGDQIVREAQELVRLAKQFHYDRVVEEINCKIGSARSDIETTKLVAPLWS
jgi:hypothetical protein